MWIPFNCIPGFQSRQISILKFNPGSDVRALHMTLSGWKPCVLRNPGVIWEHWITNASIEAHIVRSQLSSTGHVQTCQVSGSLQKWGVISRSPGIVKKTPGIEGIGLQNCLCARNGNFCVVFKQNVCLYPRILRVKSSISELEITEKSCYYPPPPHWTT